MKSKKGLSLVEILVALIIIGIIAACVSASMIGGYYMLKQAEHKSRAMSITHAKLQEYMAKSFDELGENDSGDDAAISKQFQDTQDSAFFNWTVNITNGTEAGRIPYKNITVQTLYTERNPRNESISSKTVRLSNIATYPLIHISSDGRSYVATPTKWKAPVTSMHYEDTGFEYNWKNITEPAGVLNFSYAVKKDVVIMYNLAITYNSSVKLEPWETVLTRCILDGNSLKEYGVITRTPVYSQVFINNILEIPNVKKGDHKINIEWCHEALNTTVWLRAYDVTILAVENKTQ